MFQASNTIVVEYLDHETGKKEIAQGPDFKTFIAHTIFLGSLLNLINAELADMGDNEIKVKFDAEPECLPRLVITRPGAEYRVDLVCNEPILWAGGRSRPLVSEGATLDHKAVRQAYRVLSHHLGIYDNVYASA